MALPILGCFNKNGDCDPNLTCDTVQPTSATVYIALTINTENTYVPLSIYYGNASDSSLYFRDTVVKAVSYYLPIGERYSVVAKYRQRSTTVYAVDGGKTKLKTSTNCGDTCYDTQDLNLNLKLID